MRALEVLRRSGAAVSARVAGAVSAVLDGDVSPEALARAAEAAFDAVEGAVARPRSFGPKPACSPGCSFCCHVHVEATEAEVIAVAAFLERTRSPEDLTALRARLATHVARVEPLDDDARWDARIPCALLSADGRCSVHPARPLRCRAFHSYAVDACRDAFEGRSTAPPPTVAALDRLHDAVEEGFERALARASVSTAPVRLEAGLLRSLGRDSVRVGSARR